MHRYQKSKIDCLEVCYVSATSAGLSRLLFLFLRWPLRALMQQTRQAVLTFKQSILLRCLCLDAIMTFNIATFAIITFNIVKFSIMLLIFNIMALRMMTFNIMTFSLCRSIPHYAVSLYWLLLSSVSLCSVSPLKKTNVLILCKKIHLL